MEEVGRELHFEGQAGRGLSWAFHGGGVRKRRVKSGCGNWEAIRKARFRGKGAQVPD